MKPDEVIQKVVRLLYDEKAGRWSIQDKGALVAAVKLQLQENPDQEDWQFSEELPVLG